MRARRAPLFVVVTGVAVSAGACIGAIANPPFCENAAEGEGEGEDETTASACEGEGEGE